MMAIPSSISVVVVVVAATIATLSALTIQQGFTFIDYVTTMEQNRQQHFEDSNYYHNQTTVPLFQTSTPTPTANSTEAPIENSTHLPESTTVPSSGETQQSTLQQQIERARRVHLSSSPVKSAGRWVYRPDIAYVPSPAHLQCLDLERQGNCNNETANLLSDDIARHSRMDSMSKKAVVNSPGILNGTDPWIWQSSIDDYQILPPTLDLLQGRRLYFVGDSLTRQWSHSVRCELQHVVGYSSEQAIDSVRYYQAHKHFPQPYKLRKFLHDSQPNDFLVYNLGHHISPKTYGTEWKEVYATQLQLSTVANYGQIPSSHIFFRTTAVRHFIRGMGDYDTNTSQTGNIQPDNDAIWDTFGGSRPMQPIQNLLALDVLHNASSSSSSDSIAVGGILDVSPMILARADASFDGNHFCLPGPMDYWSRMLYYRIHKTTIAETTSIQNKTE